MGVSTSATPICTWLVAECMSVTCDKNHSVKSSSTFQPLRRLKFFPRRKKHMVSGYSNFGDSSFAPSNLTSSIYGSRIENLMSSYLSIDHCKNYFNCKMLYASLAFFGENDCLLFGSQTALITKRRRRMNYAGCSGKTVVVVESNEVTMDKKKHLTDRRRVVVTGMGLVTPIGHDPDVFYNNLLEGVSGISDIKNFDCSKFPTRIAGEIKSFRAEEWVSPKISKRADKFMIYLLAAGKKALKDGGITEEVNSELNKKKGGVIIGTALGAMGVFSDTIEALRDSYRKVNPFTVPFSASNMGSAILAMDLGWMGPNYSLTSASATSNYCILNAAYHIIKGEADLMLCGGSDAPIVPGGLGGIGASRILSRRNHEPTKASRPWDINRDGIVLGEGAGVLLLEELEHAKRRGATIYAEFLGGSYIYDAYRSTKPHLDGRGAILCMEKTLAEACVAKEDVNYINAYAASTPSDLREYQAIKHCFGHNPELRVNSTKSMTGHLMGASGAVEAVATVKAIQTGWVHPNINLENPDEGVDMKLLVGNQKERLDIKVALSNSFGLVGTYSSILFAPHK